MRAPEATPAPVIARAMAALDRLEQILGMETEALRRGDLSAGLGHADAKAEAAATYRQVLAEIDSIGPSLATAADADLIALRRRHQLFERAVTLNLAVITTMRSVAEGILREVSDRMAAPPPAAYGPTPGRRASAPISLSLKT